MIHQHHGQQQQPPGAAVLDECSTYSSSSSSSTLFKQISNSAPGQASQSTCGQILTVFGVHLHLCIIIIMVEVVLVMIIYGLRLQRTTTLLDENMNIAL